jgi:hypothetical protein
LDNTTFNYYPHHQHTPPPPLIQMGLPFGSLRLRQAKAGKLRLVEWSSIGGMGSVEALVVAAGTVGCK